MSRLLITGATPRPPPGVNSPPRLEISTFVRDIRSFSLYIQALQTIYDVPQTATASYFQIAGIHGMPYVDWNGSPSGGRGYCVHRTELFPTWHRPYVVLFEQEVQRVARKIAGTYATERPQWEQAAADLRQPYWGWDNLATFIPPPEVISLQTVEIIVPDGRRVSVRNPFYDYAFPSGTTTGFPPPYNTAATTLRHPSNGVSQPEALRRDLNAVANQVVENTARLYSITNFRDFTLGSASTSGLESVHDTIHVRSGGSGGHMSSVPVAAFDPIFWLHHCQVDRVIDLWHARHNNWTSNAQDLTPFWRTQTTYWQSPEITDPGVSFNYSFTRPAISPRSGAADVAQESAAPQSSGAHSAQEDIQEWSARVRCKQFELGGSFSIVLFLGDVPADPAHWLTDPAFAGTFDVFANDTPDECANCNDQRNLIIYGYVHLNRAILRRSRQKSLEKDVVVPYLGEKLNWGVQKADGTAANITQIPSLEVTIECTTLAMPIGADFPTEGKPVYYHDITRGRDGGHRTD